MSDKMEDILRKVRGLLAKAASTEFEAERETFMKAADAMMEKYAIEEVMLLQKDDSKARIIERRDMDISWWTALKELDHDSRSEIFWLWTACIRHCRCFGGTFPTYNYNEKTVAVYGVPSDLSYLNLLFTDLLQQMIGHIRPQYDQKKSMGENIAIAKAAGMKYADIALWMGKPEWVKQVYNSQTGRMDHKPVDHGIMARAYKEFVKNEGKEWITVRPATYLWSYLETFCLTVRTRMHRIAEQRRGDSGDTGTTALVLRDIALQAKDAFYDDFPELRPHEQGCKCKQCTSKKRVVKYRERKGSEVGRSAGYQAGQNARIISNDPALRARKQLNQ
jgi:Protein of unknown function (DUF2786)